MAKPPPCPICRKPAAPQDNPFRPFCSQRCKEIDLASWLDGTYRISRPLDDADLESRAGWSPDPNREDPDPN